MKFLTTIQCTACGTQATRELFERPSSRLSDGRSTQFATCSLCMGATDHVVLHVTELLERHDPWPWKPHKRSTVEQVITDHPGSARWACGMLDYGNSPTKPLHLCKDAEALLQRQPRTAKQYV